MRQWGIGACWLLFLTAGAHAGNAANEYLLAAGPAVQSTNLANAVGQNCHGQSAFFMGLSKANSDDALWSIKCFDGRAFVVELHPDGSSRFLGCAAYEGMHNGVCFQKLLGE
jgi:hypothetical protein